MQTTLKRFFDFLIFSNIFLSLCVTSLVLETSLMLQNRIGDYRYPFFLFCSTLVLYCFHRIYRSDFRTEHEKLSDRHRWVRDHPVLFFTVLFSAATGVVISAIGFVSFRTLVWLVPVGVISLAYTIPLIPWKGSLIRLRDIPGLKIFLIAFVLGLTTVLLPILAYSTPSALLHPEIIFIFLRRIFFIFAITIPFDIRDMEYDRQNQTLSLPVLFGERRSKLLGILALLIFCALGLLQYLFVSDTPLCYILALVLSACPSAWIILRSGEGKGDFFYSFCLEGMMLLQCLLVMLAHIFPR